LQSSTSYKYRLLINLVWICVACPNTSHTSQFLDKFHKPKFDSICSPYICASNLIGAWIYVRFESVEEAMLANYAKVYMINIWSMYNTWHTLEIFNISPWYSHTSKILEAFVRSKLQERFLDVNWKTNNLKSIYA
jgi:hypothetical protein